MLRVAAFLFLILCEHPTLKEMFQCMFATEERPQALLTENSEASHGQNSRSTGQPKRDEAVRSGTEKTNGGGARSIGSSSPHGGHLSYIRTKTCPKKRPSGVIATRSLPLGFVTFSALEHKKANPQQLRSNCHGGRSLKSIAGPRSGRSCRARTSGWRGTAGW